VYIFNVRLYAQGVLIVETDSAALILAVRVLRQCIRDCPDRINWASVQHAFMARDITLITRQDLETFCVRQGRLVTLLVAGTPCQDFSGASSLQGERSVLILTAVGLLETLRQVNPLT
jgi:site-specific DNA-cytosine methylase